MRTNTIQNLVALLCTTTVIACGSVSPQKRVGSAGDRAEIIGSGSNRGESSTAGGSTAGSGTTGGSTAGSTTGASTGGEEEEIVTTGRITAVTINSSTNRSVKQGFGSVTLRATGTQLDEVDSALVKRGDDTLSCKSITATATSLECELEVPHGLLGDFALHLDNGSTADFARAITVTSLWVKPNDAAAEDATSSPTKPFETLAYALSFARTGDTVELAEGDYDIPVDEVPTRATRAEGPCEQSPTLDGISIDGHGSVLTGSKYVSNFVVAGTSTLRNLSLKGTPESSHGIIALPSANVTLTNVSLSGGEMAEQHAAHLCNKATLTHTGESKVHGWAFGYYAGEQSMLRIGSGVRITANAVGACANAASLEMTDVLVDRNNEAFTTMEPIGVMALNGSDVSLTEVSFESNGADPSDLSANLYVNDTTVEITASTFDLTTAGGHGIVLKGASSLTFTGGVTNITNRSEVYGIRDLREADAGETLAAALRFAGTTPGTAVDGYADDNKNSYRWFIQNSGNMLIMK
jgi:hypothetical protein